MRKTLLIISNLLLAGSVFAATLTVRVTDQAGNSVSNAMVGVVSFTSSGSPAQSSLLAVTDEAGSPLIFTITDNVDYMIFASKHGMLPTIKDQMGPAYPTVRSTGNNIFINRVLTQDLAFGLSVGRLTCNVTGFSTGTLVFSEVRNIQTETSVAFSMGKSPAGAFSTATVVIPNIPIAPADTYEIFLGIPDPNLSLGYALTLSTPITSKVPINIFISSGVFNVAGRVERQDEITGSIAFEGVVCADDPGRTPLKDCVVVLKRKNPDLDPMSWEWERPIDVAEVRTDFSGHFAFYDVAVDSYAVQIGKEGYEGRFFKGYGYNEQGYWYNGVTPIYISEMEGKIILPPALGRMKGRVMMSVAGGGSIPVPNAYVNVNPDWSNWPAVPYGVPTSSGGGYDNYYTTGQARSSRGNASINTNADGSFEFTGLSHGNYVINVNSEFAQMSGGYAYNFGSDRNQETIVDNLRVTVSTTWVCSVYNSTGAQLIEDSNSTPIVMYISTITAQGGTVSGRIDFDVNDNVFTIPPTSPIMIWAYEQNNSGENQKRYFTAIYGTIYNKTTDYAVNVTSGTKYWLQTKAKDWGVMGNTDNGIDLTSQNSITGYNFKMAPAGRVRGLVRLPDGQILKRTRTSTYESWINVQARGTDVSCYGWGEAKEDGYFEVTGLIPGTYNLYTIMQKYYYLTGDKVPSEWPDAEVSGIKVRAGQETYLEMQLKNGAVVAPKTPSMPPSNKVFTRYGILKFPSSTGASRDALGALLGGGKDEYLRAVAFTYDPASSDPWSQKKILSGRYDFLLSRIDLFGGGGEDEPTAGDGDHYCVTVISQLKNVEVNYDPLKPYNTSYLEFESGTLGQSIITGIVRGDSTFTQKDVDIITTSGMEKFLTYIPSIMLYDADGQLKGFSMALPLISRLPEWDSRIQNRSFTLDWFKSELADYPLTYRIERLPAGQYVAVFETPNYPPMIKKVTLTSGEYALDVNFDDNNIVGSSLEGVVKSTDGIMLPDCTILLSHRTVSKTITTDPNGAFSLSGLPMGTYRMSVNKPGFAPASEKFGLGVDKKYFTGSDAILLSRSDMSISGTVYSQKIPTPKVIVGAKIVAYNETYNTQNPGKMLPVLSTKTDEQGQYMIDGMISGNIYKVYVIAPGKILEWRTLGTAQNPLNTGANTGVDFVLRTLPPRLKITMSKIYENGRFLYKFFIESPKKVINPSNPASLAAPYCRYSPVSSASGGFDPATAVEVLPNIGPEISNPDGGKIYNYSLKIPVTEDNEYYKLRIQATDGSNDFEEDILFGPKIEARAKKDMKEEIAEGGDITIDETGADTTQITVDPGAFTPTGAEVSTVSQNDVEIPIGGFLSSMPNFNLSKTGSSKSAAMAKIVDSIVASDVYEVDLQDAQMNKSLSLNLKFDMDRVNDTELAGLQICQFNGIRNKWEVIRGAVTVDPIASVVSVDVDSVENASGSPSRSPKAGKAAVRNGMFAVNRAAATSQNGVFAVFKQDPATAKAYSGDEFEMMNFPNPFSLQQKNVTMQDANADINQTITGTLIKYSLPAANSGHIKIYIYNLAAELVKEIDEGDKAGGSYYYVEWDGKNDDGEECASGVYFAVTKCDGKKLNSKPLKLAILK